MTILEQVLESFFYDFRGLKTLTCCNFLYFEVFLLRPTNSNLKLCKIYFYVAHTEGISEIFKAVQDLFLCGPPCMILRNV